MQLKKEHGLMNRKNVLSFMSVLIFMTYAVYPQKAFCADHGQAQENTPQKPTGRMSWYSGEGINDDDSSLNDPVLYFDYSDDTPEAVFIGDIYYEEAEGLV
jgi:hypothetical protein